MEKLILVDNNDNELGSMEKMEAHRKGLLHRAFSILIFDKERRMLLQKRAASKYHCGGLWTNACCGHQRPDESTFSAAHRRLGEEMGFDAELKEDFVFEYRVEFDNGLIEHEIDHVLVGHFDGEPDLNPDEAEDYEWMAMNDLKKDIAKQPEKYTPWFRLIVERMK